MSEQIANKSSSRKPDKSALRKISVVAILILSVAVAVLLKQVWWTGFLLVELTIVFGCVELLARNLPQRIRLQMNSNSHRADGNKSKRRTQIERNSLRRFKVNTLFCISFALIPMHACWLAWCFFLPQIKRFNETVVWDTKNDWLAIFFLPTTHILVLATLFALFTYGSLRGIYLSTLKELDKEVCERAENYTVYDLVNPQTTQRRRK